MQSKLEDDSKVCRRGFVSFLLFFRNSALIFFEGHGIFFLD